MDVVCGIMDDESVGSELDRYAAVNSLLLDAYGEICLDHVYANMIQYLSNVSWELGLSGGKLF